MTASEKFSALLEEFSSYMGFDRFQLDDNGEALLVFDDELPVLLHFDAGQELLTFDGDLGRPKQHNALLMQTLLEASNQWRELDVWFSLHIDSKTIHMHRRMRLEHFPDFQQALEGFVQLAGHWRQLISVSEAAGRVAQNPASVSHQEPAPGIPV